MHSMQQAISEFQKLSLSKRDQVQNLSCENQFYMHEIEMSFSYQWLCSNGGLSWVISAVNSPG